MPIAGGLGELFGLLPRPDFLQWTNPAIYTAGFTIATMATLETLLNLGRSIGWIRSNGPRRRARNYWLKASETWFVDWSADFPSLPWSSGGR